MEMYLNYINGGQSKLYLLEFTNCLYLFILKKCII